MLRGLKVVMVIYATIVILFGLGFTIIPNQILDIFGFSEGPAYLPYFLGMLGISFIAPSVFIMVAARDPIRHINLVKLAILWSAFGLAVEVYSVLRDFVSFKQVAIAIAVDGVSVVALLVFYPWRAARNVMGEVEESDVAKQPDEPRNAVPPG